MDLPGSLWLAMRSNLPLLFAMAGLYLVLLLAHRHALRSGLPRQHLGGLELWVPVAALAGARLSAVLPDWDLYLRTPTDILRVNLGLSFYGALAGAAAAMAVACRRGALPFFALADSYALYSPLGIALYRLGCLAYGECGGRIAEPPLGLVLPGQALGRYPSDLYEAALALALLGILAGATRRVRAPGVVTGLFLVGYGLARAMVDLTRVGPYGMGGGDLGPALALAAIGLAFLLLRWRHWRRS